MLINSKTFSYDKKDCLNYNLVIGYFDGIESIAVEREIIKSEINSNQLRTNIYSVKNNNNLIFKFGILKKHGEPFTEEESIEINEWLLTDTLKELSFDDTEADPIFYMALCTNIKDIYSGNKIIGKELTFETDSIYGFTQNYRYKITSPDKTLNIRSLGSVISYPIIKVNCNGKIKINVGNSSINLDMSKHKEIVIDNENMIIYDNNVPIYLNEIMDDDSIFLYFVPGSNKISVESNSEYNIEFYCKYPRKVGNS